jgi:hypothetical protein
VLALGDRYRRARGRGRCALALDLMDGGAQPRRRRRCGCSSSTRDFYGLAPRSTSPTAPTTRSSTWGGTSR